MASRPQSGGEDTDTVAILILRRICTAAPILFAFAGSATKKPLAIGQGGSAASPELSARSANSLCDEELQLTLLTAYTLAAGGRINLNGV